MGPALKKSRCAKSVGPVLIVSRWRFCITPVVQVRTVLVSEVVDEAWRKQHRKPKPLPIPKQTEPKSRPKPQKRTKPRAFNKPKPDDLS